MWQTQNGTLPGMHSRLQAMCRRMQKDGSLINLEMQRDLHFFLVIRGSPIETQMDKRAYRRRFVLISFAVFEMNDGDP
jgi:hypothetical protein